MNEGGWEEESREMKERRCSATGLRKRKLVGCLVGWLGLETERKQEGKRTVKDAGGGYGDVNVNFFRGDIISVMWALVYHCVVPSDAL